MPATKKRKFASIDDKDSRPIDLTALSDSGSEVSDGDGLEFLGTTVSSTSQPKQSNPSTTPSHSRSTSKSINDVLKDRKRESDVHGPSSAFTPSSSSSANPMRSLPPLELATPEMVAKHTPCSLHLDFLPSSLAERLYRRMLAESPTWTKNKWYLNDRQVESPHTTAFYSTDEHQDTAHWYMGRKVDQEGEKPRMFPDEMLEARDIVEKFVNEQLVNHRKRFPLEYAGPWRANVAAANRYRGSTESVGAHADQLTYLGPYPTIASISLGTTRNFRLRAVPSVQHPAAPPPRTFDVRLPHNSLCIMGAGCQERFKHAITPARSIDVFKLRGADGTVETFIDRINITFRFYRPDFRPEFTPICKCGIPCVLRADAKGRAAAAAADVAPSDDTLRFFWQCNAGTQNEGRRCSYFKLLDMNAEDRGPCLGH